MLISLHAVNLLLDPVKLPFDTALVDAVLVDVDDVGFAREDERQHRDASRNHRRDDLPPAGVPVTLVSHTAPHLLS